ncbi:hypothetical protein EV368DRAFT_66819 [Lentinula lateritia]|uniref:Uncharacterized protein n=1 Tax=Lentinula aff. lateritia TaxID=2804960 RepID=A0ACC1TSV9_9AGAR|nr:hypothetical protein F5876DRAFT_67812 [Lentinula aff. lateritia]KAJ3850181.1 hypothetical protein EV368DRAFT_66819 [Lentinula lateritia]
MFPCTSLDALERNLKVLEKKFHLCLLEGTLNYEDSVKFEILWIGLKNAFSKIQVESYEARLFSPIQRVFLMKKRLFDIVGCNADVEQLQVSILYASEKTKQLQYKLEIDRCKFIVPDNMYPEELVNRMCCTNSEDKISLLKKTPQAQPNLFRVFPTRAGLVPQAKPHPLCSSAPHSPHCQARLSEYLSYCAICWSLQPLERIEVYTVLVLGLVYTAFSCAAMPLSQSELSTRAGNAEPVSFKIRFSPPSINSDRHYHVEDKHRTVQQIQIFMDRVAIGFGFQPKVQICGQWVKVVGLILFPGNIRFPRRKWFIFRQNDRIDPEEE